MRASFSKFLALVASALVVAADVLPAPDNEIYESPASLQDLYPLEPQLLAEDPRGISPNNLGRLLLRQSGCTRGYGACPNDPLFCCPLGGDCCGGGRCCAAGNRCVIVSGTRGCCPVGRICTEGPTTTRRTTYVYTTPTTTRRTTTRTTRTPEWTPTTTTSRYTPPPTPHYTPPPSPEWTPPPTTTTTTEQAPPPNPNTVTSVFTVQGGTSVITQIITTTSAAAPPPTPNSTGGPPTGAIVGGVVGGVAGIAILFGAIMFMRRKNNQDPAFTDEPSVAPSQQQHYNYGPQAPPPMQQYDNSYFQPNAGGYPAPAPFPPQHPNLPELYNSASPAPGAVPLPMPASTPTTGSASTPRDLYTVAALQPAHTPDGMPYYDHLDPRSSSYGAYSNEEAAAAAAAGIGALGVYGQRSSIASSPSGQMDPFFGGQRQPQQEKNFGARYDEPAGPSSSTHGAYNNTDVGASGTFGNRSSVTSSPPAQLEPYNEKQQGKKNIARDFYATAIQKNTY